MLVKCFILSYSGTGSRNPITKFHKWLHSVRLIWKCSESDSQLQPELPQSRGMLPKSLLVAVFFYISARQCTAEEIGFTSQLQLGASTQCPFDAQGQNDDAAAADSESELFTPSHPYPLPPTSVKLKSRPTTVYRPRSLEALHKARLRSSSQQEADSVIWDPVKIEGPDVEDLHTLAQLARMSGNAYALPGQKNWYDVDRAWNMVCFFIVSF